MINAKHRVGYYHLISNKCEWNNNIVVLLKHTKIIENQTEIKMPQKFMHMHAIFVGYGIMAHHPWGLSQWKLSNCIIQWSSF